jgi:hypothetical protein
MKHFSRPKIISAAVAALAVAAPLGTASAATVVVNEANIGVDWSTGDTRPGGSIAFVNEFGAPAGLGAGALQMTAVDSAAKAQFVTSQDAGTLLADMSSIGYSTYRSSVSTGSAVQVPSINVAIDENGAATGGFTTLVFEPVYNTDQGAIVDNVWQSWDASGSARWWSTRPIPGVCAFECYVALDDILAANPDATILGYGVNLGSGNPGIVAAVDGLTVGQTTFDFEPRAFAKEDCKDRGWESNFDGQFTNQGDCVSYFASNGRTHPES